MPLCRKYNKKSFYEDKFVMSSDPFEAMKGASDDANSEDTVLLSILGDDLNIKIHEGSAHSQIDHEPFLSTYYNLLKINVTLILRKCLRVQPTISRNA